MIVVDASCLAEVLVAGAGGDAVRARLRQDEDHVAPHAIDIEVLGVVRRLRMLDRMDETAAMLAIDGLRNWPGERFAHTPLLGRAWELRESVRGWDAVYVALAEVLDVPLVTRDGRLARASGPRCPIELVTD